jgi:hypothetical protein
MKIGFYSSPKHPCDDRITTIASYGLENMKHHKAVIKCKNIWQTKESIGSKCLCKPNRSFHKIQLRDENFKNLYPYVFQILSYIPTYTSKALAVETKLTIEKTHLQKDISLILKNVQTEIDQLNETISKPLKELELKILHIREIHEKPPSRLVQFNLKSCISISLGTLLLTGYIYILLLLAKNLHL